MARPTIADVARTAGVSTATVSQTLNRPERVAPATRERVHAVIAEIGYIRNASARQLRDGRSRVVGLVVTDTNPFTVDIARGVEATMRAEGYVVIFCSSGSSAAHEEESLRLLEQQAVDGVLFTPVTSADLPELERLRALGSHVVLFAETRQKDRCSVWVDDTLGARLAGEHLIELGHRRLGLVNTQVVTQRRRAGFLASLEAAGLELDPLHDVATDEPSVEAGVRAGNELLDRNAPPTAVFCGNDLLAIGVLSVALDRGLSIPEDLAIVGYDDIVFARLSAVPLTSVRQPSFELGRLGAQLLLSEAHHGARHVHQQIEFKPELIARASTLGPAAAEVTAARSCAAPAASSH